MADEVGTSAPSGGAPSSGGGSPVSTPSTPSTPATQATPVTSAPATPATAPVKQPGEADDKFLTRYHEFQDAQPKTGDELPEKPVEAVKPAVEAEPAKEPVKEVAKPVEEVKTPETPDPLETSGPLPASELTQILADNPELDAALEASGLKDRIFESSRLAAEAEQYRAELPTIETARHAKQAAITLHKMDEASTNLKPGDLQSTSDFIRDIIMPMGYILDEDGNPRMKEVQGRDGKMYQVPETDGTAQTFLNNVRDVGVEQLVADAQQLLDSKDPDHQAQGERLLAAAQELQNWIKGDDRAAEELPEHLKAERARIEADKKAMNDRISQEADQRFETFRNDTLDATNDTINKSVILPLIDKSTLAIDPNDSEQTKTSKQFMIDGIITKIREGIHAKLNKDDVFLMEQDTIARRGYSAKTKAELVNLYNRNAQRIIGKIAAPIIQAAGHERVRQVNSRASKIAAQEKASKMEPRGVTQPAKPVTSQVDERAIMAEGRKQLLGELRRDPTGQEAIDRFRQLLAKAQQPA